MQFILPTFLLLIAVSMVNMKPAFAASSVQQNFSGWAGGCTGGTHCNVGTNSSLGFTCTAATCTGVKITGSDDGQFLQPNGIAVDSTGNVYVADSGNNRVDKFSSNGSFVGWAGGCTSGGNCLNGVSVGFTCTTAECGLPVSGSDNGQFSGPQGVGVDSTGNVYVADSGNSRVEKFSSTGTFLVSFGSSGNGDGEFQSPIAVAIDSYGNVYVGDSGNNRVDKFSSNGSFVGWAGGCTGGSSCNLGASLGFTCTAVTCGASVYGSGDGQFDGSSGVGVDSSGDVYAADAGNNRVQKFSSNGSFVGWAGMCTSGVNCDSVDQHSLGFTCTATTCSKSTFGSGDGQFFQPDGIAVDSFGNVYVVDFNNNRVVKFAGGLFVGWAGLCTSGVDCDSVNQHSLGFTCTTATCFGLTFDSGDGQFNFPAYVAVDSSGNVYVSDTANNRVQLFLTQ
jgi:hypothetical protein